MSEKDNVYRIFGKDWTAENCFGKELDCNYETEFVLWSDFDQSESARKVLEERLIKAMRQRDTLIFTLYNGYFNRGEMSAIDYAIALEKEFKAHNDELNAIGEK